MYIHVYLVEVVKCFLIFLVFSKNFVVTEAQEFQNVDHTPAFVWKNSIA